MTRADRARAKKKTHKLSASQVQWIRCPIGCFKSLISLLHNYAAQDA